MFYESYDFMSDMNEGERQLYSICQKYISPFFKVMPNALFNRIDEGINKIDLIAVTKKGILVIEMKDFKGWILGNENHKEWTQSIKCAGMLSKKISSGIQSNRMKTTSRQSEEFLQNMDQTIFLYITWLFSGITQS